MTGITLGGSPRTLLTHMAFYGLAAICQDAGHTELRMSWTPGMNPKPRLDVDLDENAIADLVQVHAAHRAGPQAWPQERITIKGADRGLMSPRLSSLTHEVTVAGKTEQRLDHDLWRTLQQRRHRVLDHLTRQGQGLDLRLLAALGEPCYWRLDNPQQPSRHQDSAASRLEMQPRNQGSEFVANRLSKLAHAVANRTTTAILEGLLGRRVLDEVGNDKPDSRTATGMAEPGPTDNALVWCALWGISQAPLAFNSQDRAKTSICLRNGKEYFYLPIWRRPLHPARLRTLLVSDQMRAVAEAELAIMNGSDNSGYSTAAYQWSINRHITALLIFPINVYGSKSAPERRAGEASLHPLVQPFST